MCEYTKVEYGCGHLRYTVRAWCTKYSETHKRCPTNVVAVEYRLEERCPDCKDTPSSHLKRKQSSTSVKKGDASSSAGHSGSTDESSSSSKNDDASEPPSDEESK